MCFHGIMCVLLYKCQHAVRTVGCANFYACSDVRHARCVLYNSTELSVVIHTVKHNYIIVETESGGTRERTGGEVKGKKANGAGNQHSCPVSDTVYPALLPLMRILRLLAAD